MASAKSDARRERRQTATLRKTAGALVASRKARAHENPLDDVIDALRAPPARRGGGRKKAAPLSREALSAAWRLHGEVVLTEALGRPWTVGDGKRLQSALGTVPAHFGHPLLREIASWLTRVEELRPLVDGARRGRRKVSPDDIFGFGIAERIAEGIYALPGFLSPATNYDERASEFGRVIGAKHHAAVPNRLIVDAFAEDVFWRAKFATSIDEAHRFAHAAPTPDELAALAIVAGSEPSKSTMVASLRALKSTMAKLRKAPK